MRIGKLFDPHRTRMDMPARMTPAVWICRGIMSILTVTRIARYTRALVLRSALRRLEKFWGGKTPDVHLVSIYYFHCSGNILTNPSSASLDVLKVLHAVPQEAGRGLVQVRQFARRQRQDEPIHLLESLSKPYMCMQHAHVHAHV